MAYPWTVYKSWVTGEVLTASDLNNSFSTVITNASPSSINDDSGDVTAMQATVDPYPAAAESLATTLAGEIERLRYLVKQITGEAQWYIDPATDLTTIKNGTLTIAGAKTFSTAVTINPVSNQLVLGATRTVTLTAPTPASSSRTVTFPDLSGDYSVVGTSGTQTIAGSKTFSSAVAISATSNHLVLSTASNTLTISAASQASARVWSVPDISGNGTFAALEGTQTFSGSKTFSADTVFSADIYTTAWTDYSATSTITGWSSFSTKTLQYKKIGKLVFVSFSLTGTSNAAAASFTLPFSSDSACFTLQPCFRVDNGGTATTGRVRMTTSASLAECGIDMNTTAGFTTSGTKSVIGQFWYQTA